MIDHHSTIDIDKISLEILKGSKSLDIFPTPIDKIINYSELVVNDEIDIAAIHESYISMANDALVKALSKVRGLFDRKEKTIYLDLSQLPSRKNFVKLHEVGHGVLPWQKGIHDIIEDDDDSLGSHTTEEFEAEANYFASVTLFQHDRFINELSKLNLGIESAIYLSKLFGSSIHAALRRYVEFSPKRCALLVLENITLKGSVPKCTKRDFFVSKTFSETFGSTELPEEFGYSWKFTKDYYFQRKGKLTGTISLTTENGLADFEYHFFNNSYNALVFLFPVGEKQSSQTRILITTAQ